MAKLTAGPGKHVKSKQISLIAWQEYMLVTLALWFSLHIIATSAGAEFFSAMVAGMVAIVLLVPSNYDGENPFIQPLSKSFHIVLAGISLGMTLFIMQTVFGEHGARSTLLFIGIPAIFLRRIIVPVIYAKLIMMEKLS